MIPPPCLIFIQRYSRRHRGPPRWRNEDGSIPVQTLANNGVLSPECSSWDTIEDNPSHSLFSARCVFSPGCDAKFNTPCTVLLIHYHQTALFRYALMFPTKPMTPQAFLEILQWISTQTRQRMPLCFWSPYNPLVFNFARIHIYVSWMKEAREAFLFMCVLRPFASSHLLIRLH